MNNKIDNPPAVDNASFHIQRATGLRAILAIAQIILMVACGGNGSSTTTSSISPESTLMPQSTPTLDYTNGNPPGALDPKLPGWNVPATFGKTTIHFNK